MPEMLRTLVLLFAFACLGACASLPGSDVATNAPRRDTLDAFTLEGRFSLRQQDKNYSGRLSWRHAADGDEMLLASPFGQGIAEITVDASGARLKTSDGKNYAAENVTTLTQQVLGYALPLNDLADWLRGRSHVGTDQTLDSYARPLHLRETGWRIAYEYAGGDDDPQALPVSLFIERDGDLPFDLRLRIDECTQLRTQLPTQAQTQPFPPPGERQK